MPESRWRRFRHDLVGRTFYPRFQRIVRETRGLMRAEAYRQLYDVSFAANDLDIVEVGAGSGGSSIALALGVQDSGKRSHVVVIDKCEGGSRVEIGGYQDNLRFLHANLERFGVAETVRVCPIYLSEDNAGEVFDRIDSPRLAGLVHDADGRIDRDFAVFWPHLTDGAFVVIDDCSPRKRYCPKSVRHPDGGTKRRVAYLLLAQFAEWGLFRETGRVRNTVFGVKPPGADFRRFDRSACASILAEVERERRADLDARGLED